jgi:hypothetical protein
MTDDLTLDGAGGSHSASPSRRTSATIARSPFIQHNDMRNVPPGHRNAARLWQPSTTFSVGQRFIALSPEHASGL